MVKIYDITGEYAVTLEDGQQLYETIHPELASGQAVELDFAQVRIFASPFFNAGIGQLLKDISADDLNRLLVILNITDVGGMILRRVIENAKQYYSLDEAGRQRINEILSQDPESA